MTQWLEGNITGLLRWGNIFKTLEFYLVYRGFDPFNQESILSNQIHTVSIEWPDQQVTNSCYEWMNLEFRLIMMDDDNYDFHGDNDNFHYGREEVWWHCLFSRWNRKSILGCNRPSYTCMNRTIHPHPNHTNSIDYQRPLACMQLPCYNVIIWTDFSQYPRWRFHATWPYLQFPWPLSEFVLHSYHVQFRRAETKNDQTQDDHSMFRLVSTMQRYMQAQVNCCTQ